jgi:hypothetical protein
MNNPQISAYQDPVLVVEQLALGLEAWMAFLLRQPGWPGE